MSQLLPTHEEVSAILRETGALRDGHFRYPNGLHSDRYLQIPLAMRVYQHQKMLSVALSRLVRANPEIRAIIPELSIVCPATGGLPIAYTLCEALRARQVYWAEQESLDSPLKYRQFLKQEAGEKVLLVDITDVDAPQRIAGELKERFGGVDLSILGSCVVVEEISRGCAGIGLASLTMHSM